jgi:acetyltransferase-like isoleucine patch superfamily enzyme
MTFIEGIRENDRCDIDALTDLPNSRILLHNGGNKVRIGDGVRASSLTGNLTGDAELDVGANCSLGHVQVHIVQGARLLIGERCAFNGRINLFLHEPSTLRIGPNCLFGGDVLVTTSDMHSIIDTETGERFNWAEDIEIGEHVWIGSHATILKGVTIGSGAVIGAYAVVTNDVPASCVAAANPARVVRRNATWQHQLSPRISE